MPSLDTSISALARQLSEMRLDTIADHPEAWPWTGFRSPLPRRPPPRPGIGHDAIVARLDALRPRNMTMVLLMHGGG